MRNRPLRIAFGRIAQETNSFSPVASTLEDFRRVHLHVGADLLARCQPRGVEAEGFVRDAELSGFVRAARRDGAVEPVPLLSAWAVPGGPLRRADWDSLRADLFDRLDAAGGIDGLLLSLHGALGVEGLADAEGDLATSLRERLGDRPLAITLDLHAQLTPALVDPATVLAAYQTNPHRDHAAIGRRAGELLIGAARGEIEPVAAWRSLPMLTGGGYTIDFLPPMRPLFRRIRSVGKRKPLLTASLFMAHLWNDAPAAGWAAHVVADADRDAAEREADALAEALWALRHHAPPVFPPAEDVIAEVRAASLRRRFGAVCVCDASDVVGAGAPGESTNFLRALLEQGSDLRVLAPLRDAAAVEMLRGRQPGDEVELDVGGRFDPATNPPLRVRGRLKVVLETRAFGGVAALDVGRMGLVLTEGPPLAMKPAFYRQVGYEPFRADLVVVKSLFPFRLYFLAENRRSIYVRTRGVTDFEAGFGRTFDGPVHPLQDVADWREADRRRRGVRPAG
jgi:microcystin degradation protein MlrC